MNTYINVNKSVKGFSFDVSGIEIAATQESIQKLVDFTISKLPVAARKTLADNLVAEKTFILDEKPDWIETIIEAGWKAERANKLSWHIFKEGKEPLTSDDVQSIGETLKEYSLESVDDIAEYKKESVTIGGHNFDVSLPLTVCFRKKQERKEKESV